MGRTGHSTTYKVYPLERIKKVSYHGQETHPLYVRLTYRRRNFLFKSYYFDLFLGDRYARNDGQTLRPSVSLEEVVQMEMGLLAFVERKMPDGYALEDFKTLYDYYGRDLCTLTELDFRIFLLTFFQKRRLSVMGAALTGLKRKYTTYHLMEEVKRCFDPGQYRELIDASFAYGPFGGCYLPLYGFQEQLSPQRKVLTAMNWEDDKIRKEFAAYLAANYPDRKPEDIMEMVSKRLLVLLETGA